MPTPPMRHATQQGKFKRVAYVTAFVLTGLLSFTGTALAVGYNDINSSIKSENVNSLLGERPQKKQQESDQSHNNIVLQDPFKGEAANVLIIGSDERGGDNGKYGDTEGMRSDTVMLAHISADRESISVISIPRDSWVTVPSCTLSDGTQTLPQTSKFNASFALGGQKGSASDAAACTIKTIESLTDVFIDGYVVVDFTGFEDVVDAVGGIPYSNEGNLIAPKADLKLLAGKHVLDGETALGVMRARSGEGLDGSDISRIGRQQDLLISLAGKILSGSTLSNPQTLYTLGTSVAESLTVSENLGSVTRLAGLAYSVRNVPMDEIIFLTVPITEHSDGNDVLWRPEADQLWMYLQNNDSKNVPSVSSGYGSKAKIGEQKDENVTKDTKGKSPERGQPLP